MLGQEPIFTIEAELDAMMSLGATPYGVTLEVFEVR
jgi:hypothetical protein